MTAEGNRGEGRNVPEGDAVTALTADPSETQLMMVQRKKRQKSKTSNLVIIVRFLPLRLRGNVRNIIGFKLEIRK